MSTVVAKRRLLNWLVKDIEERHRRKVKEMKTELKRAIKDGDLVVLKRLIQRHRSVRSPDPNTGWPLLFHAIAEGQNEIVSYLMDHGHEDEGISRDFENNTALIIAAQHKNEGAFQIYMARHPTVISLANNKGQTAIMLAVARNMGEVVSVLLDRGGDVNCADDDGSTLLHLAAAWGQVDMLYLLLSRGAAQSLNVRNKRGWTPTDYSYTSEIKDYILECEKNIQQKLPRPQLRQPMPIIPSSLSYGTLGSTNALSSRIRMGTEERFRRLD
ncbi:hypothetical protein SeMB42_g02681 [Synchytrium endobioticum]|uniref:Uncharacterized protein n=1 Tax=Synchytrium endobioticum TaxID=286115 RepID=A0A507DCA3_9FUNG|nr:hypothetical protein SeLEV6574_g02991 [Synchytrium endobioticum]TPX49224.1 hypothetical protein SeMB42_g02681 [Synchytrium endobioticum]